MAGALEGIRIVDLSTKVLEYIRFLEVHRSPDGTAITNDRPSGALYTKTPSTTHISPPLLGQQSEEILSEAGYSGEQIEDFLQKGITKCPGSKRMVTQL
ncbi:MAG: hypothetical protein GY761_02835 [Hyphomicrobiales bacterium]|nr:hypothetical protein [Hyphomicrobiales bacterium]